MAGGIPTMFQIGKRTDAATAAKNYREGASAKGSKWATNYLSSKVDPFNAAAAQAPHWLARLNEVGTAGFTAGLARVNRDRVAKLVAVQGPSLYSSGIANKGAENYAAAATALIPQIQQIAANLPPRGSDGDNEQRMLLMRRGLKAIRGQFRAK